jgi:FkbM family methyltransferase
MWKFLEPNHFKSGDWVNLRTEFMRGLMRSSLHLAWRLTGGSFWNWSPPYEYVFEITSERVHEYIDAPRSSINKWCIVGGYLGHEVPRLLSSYPNVSVDVFECSKRYLPALKKKFDHDKRVNVIENAVAAEEGKLVFYETSLTGSGSVLQLGELHKELYSSEPAESFTVDATTLDTYYGTEARIDVLQIDVQGAEMLVLQGASSILTRTRAVFLEVSTRPDLYSGSTTMDEVTEFLNGKGFLLQLLGNDTNGTGNALFVKRDQIRP